MVIISNKELHESGNRTILAKAPHRKYVNGEESGREKLDLI
jgi:hypothetical protein